MWQKFLSKGIYTNSCDVNILKINNFINIITQQKLSVKSEENAIYIYGIVENKDEILKPEEILRKKDGCSLTTICTECVCYNVMILPNKPIYKYTIPMLLNGISKIKINSYESTVTLPAFLHKNLELISNKSKIHYYGNYIDTLLINSHNCSTIDLQESKVKYLDASIRDKSMVKDFTLLNSGMINVDRSSAVQYKSITKNVILKPNFFLRGKVIK